MGAMPAADPLVSRPLLGGYGRGVGWTYLSLLLTGGSTFFLAAWSVRRVGTAQYGLFALATSLTGLLAIFDYALGLTVQRAGARAHDPSGSTAGDEHRATVHAAHGAYTLLGLAGLAITVVLGGVIGLVGPTRTPYLVPTVVLLGMATSLQLGTSALPAVALACRRFALRGGATVVGVAVRVTVALVSIGRFGVAGLALAQLAGVVVERLVMVQLVRRRIGWFSVRPFLPDSAALREVTRYAFPLLLINVSGQVLALSDLVAVGALVGASAVGVYQVSSLAPLYLVTLLAVGYNVIFPALAASDDAVRQEKTTAILTRLFSYSGAVGFTLAALLRDDVVQVLLGRRDDVAANVLLVLCAMSLANVMVHGLASLLIARGRQALMARAVAIELPVNLVLTVVLVLAIGVVGAAVGTLVTAVLMDFVILPLVSRGEFGHSALTTTVRHGVVPAAIGAAIAVVAGQVAGIAGTPALRLVLGGVCAGLLAVAAGLVMLGEGGRATVREAFTHAGPTSGLATT